MWCSGPFQTEATNWGKQTHVRPHKHTQTHTHTHTHTHLHTHLHTPTYTPTHTPTHTPTRDIRNERAPAKTRHTYTHTS